MGGLQFNQKNTKLIDRVNAREMDQLLSYLSLFDKEDENSPNNSYFDGSYIYGEQSGIRREGLALSGNLTRLAESIREWNGRFVLFPDASEDAYGLTSTFEIQRPFERLSKDILISSRGEDPKKFVPMRIRTWNIDKGGILRERGQFDYYRSGGRVAFFEDMSEIERNFVTSIAGNTVMHLYATENQWSAKVCLEPGMPSVGFFTDPTGICQFLKFREVEPGKNRRDSLLHWVEAHWRQNRNDPEIENYVREHLRGKKRAAWHGMDVEIRIPPVDEAHIEIVKEDRQRLKRRKMDRRRRTINKFLDGNK